MPDARDVQSVLDEAERAATGGDYLAAAELLREAAAQQEQSLGPFHPDLANTLNNLAVVYETIDRPADAERCYRRAYAIAMTSLEPGHPFVATSEKNCRDFCAARGIPFEPPTPLPSVEQSPAPLPAVEAGPASLPAVEASPAPLEVQTPEPAIPELRTPEQRTRERRTSERRTSEQPPERPADVYVAPPAALPSSSRSRAAAVLAGLGLVTLVAAGLWYGANSNVATPSTTATSGDAVPPETVAPPPPLEPPAPNRESSIPPVAEPAPSPAAGRAPSAVEGPISARGTQGSGQPTVDAATLCTDFSTRDWRCNPTRGPIDSGQLFFYTRIKSSTPMTVEHRWYRGDQLHRVVPLRIQANERSGFRTYSRTPVKQGDWRVELRTRDGAVLHEEKFAVR